MSAYKTIGFIGLGVMGEPICRNLVKKSGAGVITFDLTPEPLARLRAEGASVAGSVAEVVSKSDIVFLCLPSAKHARAVFEGDGILKNIRQGRSSSISAHHRSIRPVISPGNCKPRGHRGPTRRSRGPGRRRRTARSV
jgi:3-hydroxyisobutyrate dehydrogenase-like beta-hydroxyacid dehydrogenase